MISLINKNNSEINLNLENPDDILINIFHNSYKLKNKSDKHIISNLNYSLIPMFDITLYNIILVNKFNVFEKMKFYN